MEWTKYNVGTTRDGKMLENPTPPNLGQFILGRIADMVTELAENFLVQICRWREGQGFYGSASLNIAVVVVVIFFGNGFLRVNTRDSMT
jgi:hypothetical protein